VLEGTFINKTNKSMKTSKKAIISMLALGMSFAGFSQATLGARSATSAATRASLSTNAAARAVTATTTATRATVVTANQINSNSQDNLGKKVSVIAKDKSTTGTDKAAAIKAEVDANVKADLTTGSDKSAEAKTKASTKAADQAKTKSNAKSNVH
jgi:hypothetical protein